MGLMKRVLWFLGGKPPEIIFENGEVSHRHPEKKWKDWDARFRQSTYDWRHHKATEWDKSKREAPKK
jgi:hypothetical protein